MWALGVVAYILMSGCPPFYHDNDEIIKKKIKTIDYNFDDEEWWGNKSQDCMDWIKALLAPSHERLTAK